MHGLDTKRFHWRGWFGIVLLVPAGALAVLSRPLVAEGTAANVLVDVLAWTAFVCGACFRVWATLYVGGQKGLRLVTEGPYSLSRNPLYLGSFLLAVSVALFLKSLTSLVAVVLAGAGYAAFTIPAEERYLLRQFGEAYRVYWRQTPRFLPRPRAFHTTKVVEVHLGALHRECWKGLGWIMMPVIAEVIAHLRVEPWWPRLLRLP